VIHIYVEGGSAGVQKTYCRRAFKSFIGKVIPEALFTVTACGDRRRTFEAFNLAIISHPNDQVVLLVDSEEQVTQDIWVHLAQRTGDGWQKPQGIRDDQAHLMVQVMESWFLADPNCLSQYFGTGFSRSALSRNNNLEDVSKIEVYGSLDRAVKNTKKKHYHKTRDGFPILAGLSPQLVRQSFVHAEALLSALEQAAGA
jgi:hypothetical protein